MPKIDFIDKKKFIHFLTYMTNYASWQEHVQKQLKLLRNMNKITLCVEIFQTQVDDQATRKVCEFMLTNYQIILDFEIN